jgi:YesN/AraC family two-component response regulator
MGYEVIDIAHSGNDAVEKTRNLQPDRMLLDIMIPGKLDGIQVAKTVKS